MLYSSLEAERKREKEQETINSLKYFMNKSEKVI